MKFEGEPSEDNGRGRGRPRQGDAPDPAHVERIALSAFAAVGYDGTSVRQIAARAGVDPALITRRYGSKFGLWQAIVDQLAARLAKTIRQIEEIEHAKGVPPAPTHIQPAQFQRASFQRAIALFAGFCCDVPELGRFFTGEIASPGERRDHVLKRIWNPSYAVLFPLIRTAQHEGIVRGHDADILVFQLIGMVSMPLMMTPAMEVAPDAVSPPASAASPVPGENLHGRLLESLERLLLND